MKSAAGDTNLVDFVDLLRTTANIISGIIGLPRALANSGWKGLNLVLIITVTQAYTGLLGRLFIKYPFISSYSDLVWLLVGIQGSILCIFG